MLRILLKKISLLCGVWIPCVVFLSAMTSSIGSSVLPQVNMSDEFKIRHVKPMRVLIIIPKTIKNDSLMDSVDVANVIKYHKLTEHNEKLCHLPTGFLLGLIHAESVGDRYAVSAAGAEGVVQLTPVAIRDIQKITGRWIHPFNPSEALWGAAKFIQYYRDIYKNVYKLSDEEAVRYAAIYYLGGGKSVEKYRKGQIVVDKYTGISVADYADILMKRTSLYRDLFPAI
jgi:hypothetical protein